MVTTRRNVAIGVTCRLLEAEANEVVGGDQALGLGRVLAALDRMTEKRPGDSTHPRAVYGIEVHVDHSCGIAIAGPRGYVTAASSPSH